MNDTHNGRAQAEAFAEQLLYLYARCSHWSLEERAHEEMRELPLSLEVRSAWQEAGRWGLDHEPPAEVCIHLTVGGPHVWLEGPLDGPALLHQGMGTPIGELIPSSDEWPDALREFLCALGLEEWL